MKAQRVSPCPFSQLIPLGYVMHLGKSMRLLTLFCNGIVEIVIFSKNCAPSRTFFVQFVHTGVVES